MKAVRICQKFANFFQKAFFTESRTGVKKLVGIPLRCFYVGSHHTCMYLLGMGFSYERRAKMMQRSVSFYVINVSFKDTILLLIDSHQNWVKFLYTELFPSNTVEEAICSMVLVEGYLSVRTLYQSAIWSSLCLCQLKTFDWHILVLEILISGFISLTAQTAVHVRDLS